MNITPLAGHVRIISILVCQSLLTVLFLGNATCLRANFVIMKIVQKGVVDCETIEL